MPPDAFIAFIQNHDQIGNRALGERLSRLATPEACAAVAAVYLLLPQIPMLFMGEEWSAPQPFPFFCDFHGELAEAVRKGRCAEFAHLPEFSDPEALAKLPDPQSVETFRSAILNWSDCERSPHAQCLERYRKLIAVRRTEIIPRLPRIGGHAGRYFVHGPGAVTVQWQCNGGMCLQLDANLSAQDQAGFPQREGRILWREGDCKDARTFPPWALRWTVFSRTEDRG